jgi:hypothetical protein
MSKSLPFTEMEYLEVFTHLLSFDSLKTPLLQKLHEITDSTKIKYLQHERLNHRTAFFILMEALQKDHIEALSTIISHVNLPISFNQKIAERGSAEIIEILIENQVEIINNPHLIKIISKNPNINSFIESKIEELKELYLSEEISSSNKDSQKEIAREDQPLPVEQRTLVGEEEDFIIEEYPEEEELEITQKQPDAKQINKIDTNKDEEESSTFIQRVSEMSIPDKLKLAVSGTARDRMALIRDPNKIVCQAVIDSPKINEGEIVMIASNKSIDKDIIATIARNKQWHANYKVVSSLAFNPKTPVKDGMAFVRKLRRKDLRLMTKDRNVSQVIRNFAMSVLSSNT